MDKWFQQNDYLLMCSIKHVRGRSENERLLIYCEDFVSCEV